MSGIFGLSTAVAAVTAPSAPNIITLAAAQAPAVVHVSVFEGDDTDESLSPDRLVARYAWDFGDSHGRFNTLPGWNAAHVYDQPGDYTVSLTITDGQGVASTRRASFHIGRSTRRRIYVSLAGDDASEGPESDPVRTLARMLARQGRECGDPAAPRRHLRCRQALEIHARNVRIGAYGDGVAGSARLRKTQDSAESIFLIFNGSDDVIFDGLEFDSAWDLASAFGDRKVPARGMTVGGSNVAVRNCTFRNLSDAINTEWHPHGVLVQDCLFTNEIRSQPIWSQGTDHVYIGNVMKDSQQEHLIRASEPQGVVRLLIAHNDLSRPSNSKGSIELRCASWFYVSSNHIRGGTLRVGPQEQDQSAVPDWPSIKCRWGVVEDNVLEGIFVNVRLGTEHCVLRNNLVRYDGPEGFLIECRKTGFDEVRKAVDIRLIRNTVITGANDGHFLRVSGHGQGIVLERNLYVAPQLKMVTDAGSAVEVQDDDLSGFAEIRRQRLARSRQGRDRFPCGPEAKTPEQWARYPHVSGDRNENVKLDPNGNAPPALEAGAAFSSKAK